MADVIPSKKVPLKLQLTISVFAKIKRITLILKLTLHKIKPKPPPINLPASILQPKPK
jgi:hypothetical protein